MEQVKMSGGRDFLSNNYRHQDKMEKDKMDRGITYKRELNGFLQS